MSLLLNIQNLVTGYGTKFRLEPVNLQIEKHSITGIIGPNGCGKSTLLKSISRVLKPMQGIVEFDGNNIWKMESRAYARKVAVVRQMIEPEPISIEDYVRMGRMPHFGPFQFFDSRRDLETADKYISLCGLDSIRIKNLDSVSGGERQMAHFAQALTQEPELILLDEPTSHLDIRHQIETLDRVRRFNRETGLTVVMVLHDLNLAAEYCDHLVLLKNGRLMYNGRPEEVLDYQKIEEIYETVVVVQKNPLSGKPYVFLVSQEEIEKRSHKGISCEPGADPQL